MIEIIDLLKPKNGGSFKLIEDIDIAVDGYSSLADCVAHMATTAMIEAINAVLSGKQDKLTTAQLTACNSGINSELVTQIGTNTTAIAGKADASDVATSVNNLQSQINNIVSGSTEDSEVINARVDAGGTTYTTLKERLDADAEKVTDIEGALMNSQPLSPEGTTFAAAKCNIAKKPNTTINRFWTCAEGDSEMNPTSIYARKLAGSNMYALEPIKLKAGVTYHTNNMRVFYCWI